MALLNYGANKAPDARLDIHVRGFWERQRFAFFDVHVCHSNADSYRDLTPKEIYKKHENEKKRQYAERVMEIEQGMFTPLVWRPQAEWRMSMLSTTADLPSWSQIRREKVAQAQIPG